MKSRPTTIVIAGLIVGALGALTVLAYGGSVRGETGSSASTAKALVAVKDISAGTDWETARSSIAEKRVPADLRPQSAVTSSSEPAGRKAIRAIAAGEIITAAQFGRSEEAPDAAGLEIPPGANAVSINLPIPQGVARYVRTGDIVNVFVTMKNNPDPRAPIITKLLLSNVQVLSNRSASALGKQAGAESTGEVLLTMALTQSDAEKLIYAKENGSLWFGLVRSGDRPASTSGQTATTVLR